MGAPLPYGSRVIVYRNRTRGGWSVAHYASARSRGALIANVDSGIVLRDAVCVVLENRRQAIVAAAAARGEKKREVMAWVEGTLCAAAPDSRGERIDFDPHRGPDYFAVADGRAVAGAASGVGGRRGAFRCPGGAAARSAGNR